MELIVEYQTEMPIEGACQLRMWIVIKGMVSNVDYITNQGFIQNFIVTRNFNEVYWHYIMIHVGNSVRGGLPLFAGAL